MRNQDIDTSSWCVKTTCKGSHNSIGCYSKIVVKIENIEIDSTHKHFYAKCPYCGSHTKISSLFIPQIVKNMIIWAHQYGC